MAIAACLLDTNILLRISQRQDPDYHPIRNALVSLGTRGARLCFTSQNIAEFWNVCTRPSGQNGYGLTTAEADRRTRIMEETFTRLPDTDEIYPEWRRLVVAHSISGVKVHDARLAATMNIHGIAHILTLDANDFARYPGINAIHPRHFA